MSSQAVTISYHSVDGEIGSVCYEQGGVVTNMLKDGIGSVVTTTGTNNPNQLGRRYAPYGTCLSGQTDWSDFQMGWVGSQGYRRTDLTNAEEYMRARQYSTRSGSWTTKDPLWPSQLSYGYSDQSPLSSSDPSGLGPCKTGSVRPCDPKGLAQCAEKCVGKFPASCVQTCIGGRYVTLPGGCLCVPITAKIPPWLSRAVPWLEDAGGVAGKVGNVVGIAGSGVCAALFADCIAQTPGDLSERVCGCYEALNKPEQPWTTVQQLCLSTSCSSTFFMVTLLFGCGTDRSFPYSSIDDGQGWGGGGEGHVTRRNGIIYS